MATLAQPEQPTVPGAEVLDEYLVPFGEWVDQSVQWVTKEFDWLLDAMIWPVRLLVEDVVEGALVDLSWVVFVAAVVLLSLLFRGGSTAAFAAVALIVSGLLGEGFWAASVVTFGSLAVAMLLCVTLGLPLGVLGGVSDAAWGVIRRVLYGWQLVHAWAIFLLVIFLWGVGSHAAVVATALFALPSLVRRTATGIRQVPPPVVEYGWGSGASRWSILFDLRIPPARPDIAQGSMRPSGSRL